MTRTLPTPPTLLTRPTPPPNSTTPPQLFRPVTLTVERNNRVAFIYLYVVYFFFLSFSLYFFFGSFYLPTLCVFLYLEILYNVDFIKTFYYFLGMFYSFFRIDKRIGKLLQERAKLNTISWDFSNKEIILEVLVISRTFPKTSTRATQLTQRLENKFKNL